jgi:short chain dehydrogenase/Protein of unknown function (DUF3224)
MEPVVDPRCSHAANEPREMVMRTVSRTHADGKITVSESEASFVGVERVTGKVGGRSGTFVFQDEGTLKDGTIGKAIATALATSGARVVVNHLNTRDQAATVVAQIAASGGEAIAVAADVSRRSEYAALVEAAIDRLGSWDILVNNAGIALVKSFGEVSEEEFDTSE